jgi:dolichyl-phosphate-mannose--protein O-mannosyl transferase
VYAGLVRAAAPRLLALVAAALVLLDGYVITVEQYVMPEAFFTLTLLVALLVLVWPRLRSGGTTDRQASMRSLLVAGLLLAAAVIQREAALFVAPVCIIYLLWVRSRLRPLVAFAVAGALPLLTYAALYDAKLGVFGLTESAGWTLYG